MDKEFIKRNTEAHGWLGLIISALLFIVFFTGSISFFRHEIEQWAVQGHYQFEAYEPEEYLSISEVFEVALANRAYDPKEIQFVYPPTAEEPYYRSYILLDESVSGDLYDFLIIDPRSGDIVGSMDDFFLADFMYILHYSLNLPYGAYLIGFITLFFLFAIFSGVLIHAKDFIAGFFRYRPDGRKRSKLLDIHNVVGVISLPYTLMFAVTGLIFNLVIIYQIAFAAILYQGDVDSLLEDAGIRTAVSEWQDEAWQLPPIDFLYKNQVDAWGVIPAQVRITNYGDVGATMEIYGGEEFHNYGISYNLSDQSVNFSDLEDEPNAVSTGIGIVGALHFGNFAGFDLRVIYFLLGIAVCVLIVTGNLLWVGQREKTMSGLKLAFVSNFTLACSAGLAVASAVAFLAERILPLGLNDRGGMMVYSFVFSLAVASVYIWFVADRRVALLRLLQCFTGLCATIVLVDIIFFSDAIAMAISSGNIAIIGVDFAIASIAALVGYFCFAMSSKASSNKPITDSSAIRA